MKFILWGALSFGLAGLLWLVWIDGQKSAGGHLFGTQTAGAEAGYCLGVAERAREITRGQGAVALERFLGENIEFWRLRVGDQAVAGRMALGRDLAAPEVNEGALLHLAIQDCARRAVALYGHRFTALPQGQG